MTVTWNAPFEELEAGQPFTTRGRTVTEADVVGFAALTGDWHPQHSDAQWAADSPFGERIAHGDRKSTRLNSSHVRLSRMPSSA